MKIVNVSKNTIYVEELDLHLPYNNDEPEHIETELIKRSPGLRSIILSDLIKIVEVNDKEKIETSLLYLKNKNTSEIKTEEPDKDINNELNTEKLIKKTNKENITGNGIDVKLHGIFFDPGGYAKVNRNIAIKLHEMGFNIQVSPKRSQNQLSDDELKPFVNLTTTKIDKKHILIDSVIPTFGECSTGAYKILYTTIESYTVPKQFIDCCEQYNEIWITSEWGANLLRNHIKKPVYTMSGGVDQNLYKESGPRFDLKPNIKNFVFISVFGWNYRKGYDVLLKAYLDEFSSSDDVSLLIMSRYQTGQSQYHKNKIKLDIEEIMKQFPNKNLPHIVRYSKTIRENDMPKLYRAANCFVLPSRGECICLPPLEASLCGLPIIMSNCSGQQTYLRENNAYLLEIDHLETIQRGQMHLHYWDGQQFPSFKTEKSHKQLKKLMRDVYENYDQAKRKNKNMQNLILENLTWQHTADSIAKRLKEIHSTL